MSGSTRTVFIDTCTVQLSTVQLDSVPTSGGGRIFAGRFRSELYGENRLIPYLSFRVTQDFTLPENSVDRPRLRFDSLTLILPYDGTYCGDTTRRMSLNLHRLSEEVEFGHDDNRLYAHSRFDYEEQAAATARFFPRPSAGRPLEVRLPDEWGSDFLDKLQREEPEMEDDDAFREWFNGLVLSPGEEGNVQLGFAESSTDTLCRMRLYYTELGLEPIASQADFPLDGSLLFHAVETDRTGTPFEALSTDNNRLPTAQTGRMALYQSMSGCFPLIEFPHLHRIKKLGEHDYVVSARLVVQPLAGSYDGQTHVQLPDSMRLYPIIGLEDPAATAVIGEFQRGDLYYNGQFPKDNRYVWDLTGFIGGQLEKTNYNRDNLRLIGPKNGFALDNLIVGEQYLDGQNVQLQITYSLYNE